MSSEEEVRSNKGRGRVCVFFSSINPAELARGHEDNIRERIMYMSDSIYCECTPRNLYSTKGDHSYATNPRSSHPTI